MANSARARSTCAAGALGERLRRVKAIRSSGESGRRGSVWWRDMEYLGSTRITPSLYQSPRQVTHYRALRVFKDCVVRLWRKVLGKRSQKGRVSWVRIERTRCAGGASRVLS